MSYDIVQFSGSARVSRHNSAQDNLDNRRWNEFVGVLNALVAEYDDINLTCFAPFITDYEDPR